ncbi:GTP pyrophosphokinase [Mycetocola zhujimingii]|uniref:GTP pyrophosphokinase n=1 Tax=Mycetocola zhujimingii TaxID=2079792 RepID=UPI000D39765F|nr:GTP pyrophosphokinase family protein [Mycetocola zhujimingii]AWB85311.1 GTP pyrophosphokinase [Mycetocola zhujimingii]
MPDPTDLQGLRALNGDFTRFMMSYKFGIDEVMTKINILREEFSHRHDYSPIENVSSRLKSAESILAKADRKGSEMTLDGIRSDVHDIAGIRVTCSFISDTYKIFDMISAQRDVTVLQVRDYIAQPKANGYKSLHMIIEVPVFMSDHVEQVKVEIQIRTIAMDFWAALEHKIYYKYNRAVPERLLTELRDAALAANRLDVKMERLHDEVLALASVPGADDGVIDTRDIGRDAVPDAMLRMLAAARSDQQQ